MAFWATTWRKCDAERVSQKDIDGINNDVTQRIILENEVTENTDIYVVEKL